MQTRPMLDNARGEAQNITRNGETRRMLKV